MKQSFPNFRVLTVLGAMAVVSVVSPVAKADINIVQNGSFDLNSPAGGTAPVDWTLINAASGSDFYVGAGATYGALSAPNSANFGATGSSDDTLEQTLVTTPGTTYVLSYELAHNNTDNENDFSAIWNGTTVTGSALVNASVFPYTLYTFDVTATGTSTILAFAGREVPAWYDLDDVSVTSTTTPEPGFMLLLTAGLGGLYAFRRRRATPDQSK